MSDPIAFVSHFHVKEGALETVSRMAAEVTSHLQAEKPRTAVFLIFLDEEGAKASFIHVFADPEAMDVHFEDAEQRSQAAYEAIEPLGWEVYGTPSDAALGSLREGARAAGVPLVTRPTLLGGFMRTS
jgi:hypothetical protein